MEKIFIYCSNTEKKKGIEQVCRSLRIKLQEIGTKDLPRTLGGITGIGKDERKNVSIPILYSMPEVVVFSGINEAKLDLFLNAYRMAKIEPIALKAVVTIYNCSWTLYELIEELKKEHAQFSVH